MSVDYFWKLELARLGCKVWKSRTPIDCDDCYGPPDCPLKLVEIAERLNKIIRKAKEHGIELEEIKAEEANTKK